MDYFNLLNTTAPPEKALKQNKKIILTMITALSQVGCVSVSIEQDSKKLTCTGLLHIKEEVDQPITAVDLTGFGIFYKATGVTIGKLSETQIFDTVNTGCKTIILANNSKEIENIKRSLQTEDVTINTICIKDRGN